MIGSPDPEGPEESFNYNLILKNENSGDKNSYVSVFEDEYITKEH